MDKTATQLVGSEITAKVQLHNYRFPRSGHVSGDYAIVIFDIVRVIEGELPQECRLKGAINQYQITAVGEMPRIKENVEYVFNGTLIVDKEWGPQYTVTDVRLDYDLSRADDQRKFFSYFMTDKQVEALFSATDSPLELLERKDIAELTKIKSIGPVTAAKMCLKYDEHKNKGRAYVVLKKLDLSKTIIDKIIAYYGSADVAVDKIEKNPYVLIRDIRGIGWKKADDFAKRQGMKNNCRERIIAYTQYFLEQHAEINGNTWTTIEDLTTNVSIECAPVEKKEVLDILKEYVVTSDDFDEIYEKHREHKDDYSKFLYYDKQKKRIGTTRLRFLEKDIAYHMNRLQSSKSFLNYDKDYCLSIIRECEEEQGYEYTQEQISAIWNMLDHNVSILTGLAGAGKSATLKPVIKIFEGYNLWVEQCALSGRAASLLSEITNLQGKTIHRLLIFDPQTDRFVCNENSPLKADVIILDETSMVGGELFLSLISAIKTGAKLIMLGDVHQLESIGIANILKDSISSGFIPTSVLTKIHRQAAKSGIITESVRVAYGESIVRNDFVGEVIKGKLQDFKVIGVGDAALINRKVFAEYNNFIKQGVSPEDIQIIVPMRTRGDISCRALNSMLQQIVNPKEYKEAVSVSLNDNGTKYSVCFKPNDRIIVIKNNYHAMGLDGKDKQIFNGNIGHIKEISGDVIVINIPDVGDIVLPRDQWNNIQLAYAITVHKKQGDSTPYAIVALDPSAYTLMSRELLYTAITRATKFCTLISTGKIINMATKTSRIRTKQTWLKDDLLKYKIESEQY